MEGGRDMGSPLTKPSKFAVYQHPAVSAVLTSNSVRPTRSTFLFIFSFLSASAFGLLSIIAREKVVIDSLNLGYVSQGVASVLVKAMQISVALILLGACVALINAIFLFLATNAASGGVISPSKVMKGQGHLTNRQLGFLGLKPKIEPVELFLGLKPKIEPVELDSLMKPPKSKINSVSPSDVLMPLHQPLTSLNRSSRVSVDRSNASGGAKIHSFGTPSKSPASPYLVPGTASQLSTSQSLPGLGQMFSIPWSYKHNSSAKGILTEEELEHFLADVGEKISKSASRMATPSPTIKGFGIASPNTIGSLSNYSGTTRSTPLRPVRMSPGSQKFTTPPKKGEGDLPPPMSMEESVEAFEHLGIYPQIEQWRDHLRQWFSSVLLNPLLEKIETSHLKIMQGAAKLGISITISQVGSDLSSAGTTTTTSPVEGTNEWQPAITLDEDGLLLQLRATLVQALDASMSKLPSTNLQQSPQQSPLIPVLQECIDAINEHQRLHTLMKGEWAKGLLPQSSVRADYTVQRIRELAVGTCVKNYEYLGSGEVYDKVNQKWTLELPTDSHLLLYLFCAFLEHPKWMLHVDPTSYAGAQSSKNPLFLGVLPPKERFPEKYIAVVSGIPTVLHPGACVLAAGKQSPPIFVTYWDKKAQFSLQGRTALWDSVLLLCHRIKVLYGGIVRGVHLGSSALGILPVLDTEVGN